MFTPAQLAHLASLPPAPAHWGGRGARPVVPGKADLSVHRLPGVASVLAFGVPDTASLLPSLIGPSYQQGSYQACVAAATAGAASVDTALSGNRWDVFDWLTMYREAGGNGGNGVDPRLVLESVVERGAPLLSGAREKTIGSYTFAQQTPGVFREQVKACIAAGYPVVMACLLPMPFGWNSGSAATQGYHALMGCGFDPEFLLVRNSWGDAWPGDAPAGTPAGVGRLRWDYLESDDLQHQLCFCYVTTRAVLAPAGAA
jgi:hypothetical protein